MIGEKSVQFSRLSITSPHQELLLRGVRGEGNPRAGVCDAERVAGFCDAERVCGVTARSLLLAVDEVALDWLGGDLPTRREEGSEESVKLEAREARSITICVGAVRRQTPRTSSVRRLPQFRVGAVRREAARRRWSQAASVPRPGGDTSP